MLRAIHSRSHPEQRHQYHKCSHNHRDQQCTAPHKRVAPTEHRPFHSCDTRLRLLFVLALAGSVALASAAPSTTAVAAGRNQFHSRNSWCADGHRRPASKINTIAPVAIAVAEPPLHRSSLGDRVVSLGERIRSLALSVTHRSDSGGSGSQESEEMPQATPVSGMHKARPGGSVGGTGDASPTSSDKPNAVSAGPKSNGRNSFLAGGLAGSISTTITCPIEVVKTQLQASSVKRGSNAFSIAGSIWKNDGPRGFFRGLAPGLVGIIPARSTYFFAYSKSKEFWTDKSRLGDGHRDLTEILCGLTAGVVQNTITNPIWMVKTRMQLLADTATGQVAYGGYREAISAIWRSEGVKGFYKGMSASYWGCSEGCLYFVIYERLKRQLRQRQNDAREEKGLPPTETLPPAYLFASSAFSKMCATITTYPHEVMRTRLREQARNGVYKYTGMWQSLILVGKEEGRRGLYAGMGTHVARVVPNMAIMMLSFELISDWLRRRDETAQDKQRQEGFKLLTRSNTT